MPRISKSSENKLKLIREVYPACTLRDILEFSEGTPILDMKMGDIFPLQQPTAPTKSAPRSKMRSSVKKEDLMVLDSGRRAKSWETWPDEMKEEIEVILESNDAGNHSISMEDYRGRMRTHWELDVSSSTLRGYIKTLGRRGWTK